MKKLFILLLITICATAVAYIVTKFIWTPNEWESNLVSPVLSKFSSQKVETLPTPSPTPKTFKFNENTNLEQALETVNPEILESDFSDLKSTVDSI